MNIGGLPVDGDAAVALGFLGAILAVALILALWLIAQAMKRPKRP